MSRSGYVDYIEDPLELGRYRNAVKRAIEGKRGQAFLRELAREMDAMPEKALIANELIELGQTTGYKRSSRDTYIQRLAAKKIVVTSSEGVALSPTLFD